jgi:hypothetical protein
MTTIKLPGLVMESDPNANLAVRNYSVTQQAPAAATRTYLTGSAIAVPESGLKVGSRFSWVFNMAKTAAGTAASTIDVAVGTAGTTADTARVSFTKPAGTAAADEGRVTVDVVVRTLNATTGKFVGEFTLVHNLAATGHATIPTVAVSTVSGSFDTTLSGMIVGLCLTSGASDAITIEYMSAELHL